MKYNLFIVARTTKSGKCEDTEWRTNKPYTHIIYMRLKKSCEHKVNHVLYMGA